MFKPRGGSQTRLNWPWFHERAPFSTGLSFPLLRNLILIINPSTEREGMISCLSVQHSHSYYYYCTTGHSDPLKVTMVTQFNIWTSIFRNQRTIYMGEGHAYFNSVLAFFLFYPVISLWALVRMFKVNTKKRSTMTHQTSKHIWMSLYTYDAATSGPRRGILLVSWCHVDMMSHFW